MAARAAYRSRCLMLPPVTLINEQPAEATTPGGFGFVLTTARPDRKDRTHVQYHDEHSHFKPHRQAL